MTARQYWVNGSKQPFPDIRPYLWGCRRPRNVVEISSQHCQPTGTPTMRFYSLAYREFVAGQ
jgi:hypothetical protein